MSLFLTFIFLIVLAGVKLDNLVETELAERDTYSAITGCYNKFVGSKGSVQNPVYPLKYVYSISCEWDFDVTRGFEVVFEFEAFRLPFSEEKICDSYVEISYASQQDEVVKRVFCPTDTVEAISTHSQTAHIRFRSGAYYEEYRNDTYGFKINYRAVAVSKPRVDQHAVKIVLSVLAILLLLSICSCCVRRYRKNSDTAHTYNIEVVPREQNSRSFNSPSTFQYSMEYQHPVIQAPYNEQKFQSRTVGVNTDIVTRDYRRDGCDSVFTDVQGNRKTSIATTPRSVFPLPIKACNSENAHRIRQLRTRLVARFSSHSSPDVSVYFKASESPRYSYLSCDEDSPEESSIVDKQSDFKTREVPSIVISFVD